MKKANFVLRAFGLALFFAVLAGGLNAQTISSFPYLEGFESGLGLWTQDTGDDFNWTRKSGSTSSSNTGPTSAAEGSWYIYTESSYPNYPSKTAIIESPWFDCSGIDEPMFEFNYHMYGATMGDLYWEISPNGTTWYHVWSKSGDQGNAWDGIRANLKPYKNVLFKLRFRVVTSSSFTSDAAIDDFQVYDWMLKTTPQGVQDIGEVAYLEPMKTGTAATINMVYPNPVQQQMHVRMEMETAVQGQLTVRDLMGRTVLNRTVDMAAGWNTQTFDVDFAPGTYLVEMAAEGGVLRQKIQVVR